MARFHLLHGTGAHSASSSDTAGATVQGSAEMEAWNRTGERVQSAGTRECAHTFGNIGANVAAGAVVLPLASLARDADPKACMCSLARISLPGVVKLRAKRVTVGVGASGFVRPGSSVVSATPPAFPDLSALSFGV